MVSVSVVVVNFNAKDVVRDCLSSVENQTYKPLEVVFVDNGSSDGSSDFIEKEFPWVRLIRLSKNLGFAEGSNIGFSKSVGDFVALLNVDTVVECDWIERLLSTVRTNSETGIVVPKIYRYGTDKIFDCFGAVYNSTGHCYGMGYGQKDSGQFDGWKFVPAASACSMLIRREAIDRTYLFGNHFFMYYEEFDLSIRIRQLGYKIAACPSAVVYHHGSYSVSSLRESGKDQLLFKQFLGNRNRVEILAHYYPWRTIVGNVHLITLSFIFWGAYFLCRGGPILSIRFLLACTVSLARGLLARFHSSRGTASDEWVRDIKITNLIELLRFGEYVSVRNA